MSTTHDHPEHAHGASLPNGTDPLERLDQPAQPARPTRPFSLDDLIGIEHTKLDFFQEVQRKVVELKTANTESENSRREIAAILDGITDIMMVLSEDLRIISVNWVFEKLFPMPEGETAVGRYCYEIFRNHDEPCPECPAFRSLSTNSVCKETAFFKIDGRTQQFEMIASPLKNPEWPQHRVLIFKRDVTLEKEYQAKYYQAEKMATIGVLATGVAHEVNNPLMAISGYAEGIQRRLSRVDHLMDDGMRQDFHEYTQTILKECRRCRDIVRALLNFGHPLSNRFGVVDINAMVIETLKLLQYHLRKKRGVNVVEHLEPDLPTIEGDESQIKQVLLNLLTNASDAIEASGKQGAITVRTEMCGPDAVLLTVEDTGCGIPQNNLDKLFDPFFTTKGVGKGIGIGLSTCYAIVQEHQGEIAVRSDDGKGSAFLVTLPLAQQDVNGGME